MPIIKAPGVMRKGKMLLLCVVAFASAALGVIFISASRRQPSHRQGAWYDFSQHMNLDWSGPKVGERIDLQHFAGRGGEQITGTVDGDLIMLATIDPDCEASWKARDELRDVRSHITRAVVPYILVSATTSRPSDDFFKYAESLGVDAPAFMWASKEASPPESLATMVVPSHILVRRDGTILQTWPGTSQSKKVRFQMVQQIVADTIEVAAAHR